MEKQPQTLFIAATHGNEEFSLDVLKNIEQDYPKTVYAYDWIVGNPKALALGVRSTDADLNRVAPGDPTSDKYEEQRAVEIMEEASKYTFVVDIHGTKAECGVTTIIPYPTLRNLLLAAAFSIERNVIWYASVSLQKGPLVQFTRSAGIEIECGPKSSPTIQEKLNIVLRAFLDKGVNMTINELISSLEKKSFYTVYDVLKENGKTYSDFELVTENGEEFYPFLSANQYPGIACYKMKKVNIEDFFLV
jgi:hypothetical protein